MKKASIISICISAIVLSGCAGQHKLEKYVKLYAMPYSITNLNVSKDQIPVLHSMLRNRKYSPYWHNIARIIGYISNDPNSIYALLDYFQRDDSWNLDTSIKLTGKIQSISYMGYIGGEPANRIMKTCAVITGAEDLAKDWIDKIYINDIPGFQGKEDIVNKIRYSALTGLALTGTKENAAFIKSTYEQERLYCETNQVKTHFFQVMVDVMALRDYVSVNGAEAYKNLLEDQKIDALSPYISKYNKLEWVEKLKLEGF